MKLFVFLFLMMAVHSNAANKSLPYPSAADVDGAEIAEQLYFVNHYYYLAPMPLEHQLQGINVVVKKSSTGKVMTEVIERYLNNTYADGVYDSKEMAIFRYGHKRGSAFLITDFADESKSRMYQVWMPSLRKVRRFAQADINDQWLGTQLSFGDTTLRKPEFEKTELLETKVFNSCLETIKVKPADYNDWFKMVYPVNCEVNNKMVYVIKSVSSKETGYDYRLTYVDTESFADYRTDYFKNDQLVKRVDKDWKSMQMPDPRVMYWSYWFIKNYETGAETYIQMSREGMKYRAQSKKANFWSDATLRKLKR